MNFDDYICDGQISMFDFTNDASDNTDIEFNPLKSLALYGTGIRNGMKRIKEYFSESHTLREKVAFLKSEYGTGGFGSPVKKPCYIHQMCTSISQKLIEFEYYDENMQNVKKYCSWVDLANIISEMVAKDEYVYKDGD
jgi:hypothetical protein